MLWMQNVLLTTSLAFWSLHLKLGEKTSHIKKCYMHWLKNILITQISVFFDFVFRPPWNNLWILALEGNLDIQWLWWIPWTLGNGIKDIRHVVMFLDQQIHLSSFHGLLMQSFYGHSSLVPVHAVEYGCVCWISLSAQYKFHYTI